MPLKWVSLCLQISTIQNSLWCCICSTCSPILDLSFKSPLEKHFLGIPVFSICYLPRCGSSSLVVHLSLATHFELSYFDFTVQYVSHYATETSLFFVKNSMTNFVSISYPKIHHIREYWHYISDAMVGLTVYKPFMGYLMLKLD